MRMYYPHEMDILLADSGFKIEKKIGDFVSTSIEWIPINKISLDGEKTKSVINFLEALENDEDVQHVALLCRIALASDEIQVLRGQLSNILDQFVILKQLSTEDVPATAHSLSLFSVMRPDVALDSLERARQLRANEPIEYKHTNELNGYPDYFDIVQSLWVIFHFEDLEEHFAQIKSVLKLGGVYYAHTGEHSESKVWPNWKAELEKRTQLKTYTHSPEQIVAAFENQGFEVEVIPWNWEDVAYIDDFKPTIWHPTREIYEDHYLNRILMFRAVLQD